MEPIYEKQAAVKLDAPREREISYWQEETRYNLPFADKDDTILYFSHFWYKSWYTPTQYHDYFEICYVCEGKGWFILEGIQFAVTSGDIFLTKPGEVHCGGSSDDSFVVYAVGFRFDRTSDLENGFFKLGLQRICCDLQGEIRRDFDRIKSELESGHKNAHLIVRSVLTAALVGVLRLYEAAQCRSDRYSSQLAPIVLQALQYIHSEVKGVGKINEVADAVNISRSHLDREFKRQMGVSLGEYIRGVWLSRAKMLLRETNESITNIADMLYFDSLQAFCTFFKRQTGIPPQQYRHRNHDM